MARKRQRNHKAEYQARKQRAQAAGYSSVKQYTAARKRLGIRGGRVSPVPSRVAESIYQRGSTRDAAAQAWSNRHSKASESRWSNSLSEPERENFFNAYVKPSRNKSRWKKAHHDYLVPNFYSEEEYNERYGSPSSSAGAA